MSKGDIAALQTGQRKVAETSAVRPAPKSSRCSEAAIRPWFPCASPSGGHQLHRRYVTRNRAHEQARTSLAPVPSDQCRVCGSLGPFKQHLAREMLFGTREEFEYVECTSCGSLQIREIPDASVLTRHYPDTYYSFNANATGPRLWLYTQRDRHLIGRWSPVGRFVDRYRQDTTLPLLVEAGIRPTDRILDVGCGRGHLLDRLARLGFEKASGADPFIAEDLQTPAGVRIQKSMLEQVEGEFDVVMFHHSLEHVPDPTADLASARARLRPGGLCIVRLPTTDSDGWSRHGVHWSSLDPPRHLVLPSREGMKSMANRAGLDYVDTIDDSYGGQYLISELYARDISASDPEANTTFGKSDHQRFAELADVSNRTSRGDQAMFVFRSPVSAATR